MMTAYLIKQPLPLPLFIQGNCTSAPREQEETERGRPATRSSVGEQGGQGNTNTGLKAGALGSISVRVSFLWGVRQVSLGKLI